jgi:LysR family glycine cleavage system transcriptional activator
MECRYKREAFLPENEWNSCMLKFRHIPPTQFLKGFEAAARLESFSRAAEEVGLTQSAISHQMRLLEAQIGQPLFLRIGREVRLTDAGRDYHRTVRRSLEIHGGRLPAPGALPQARQRRHLCTAGFHAALAPAAPAIAEGGGARLRALARQQRRVPVDFETMEADIAIIHAPRAAGRLRKPADRARPSCRPPLTSTGARGTSIQPADLLSAPLIHDEGPVGWPDWLGHVGIHDGNRLEGRQFQ